MALIQVSCSHCSETWDVSKTKRGGHVNCPACGVLVSVKGTSDSKLFYGLLILGVPLTLIVLIVGGAVLFFLYWSFMRLIKP